MSAAFAARRLTEAHRVAQANIALDSVGKLTAVWKTLMKSSNLDDYAAYMKVMASVIASGRATSAQVAAAYYDTHRELLGIDEPYSAILADAAPLAQIETSLLVTGPVRVKLLLGNGDDFMSAMNKALRASAGSTTRLVADGGRATIRDNVQSDGHSVGWQRIADGDPCAFCEMLAGRGAVYKSESTAGGDDPYHDHCLCTVEPVYFRTRDSRR